MIAGELEGSITARYRRGDVKTQVSRIPTITSNDIICAFSNSHLSPESLVYSQRLQTQKCDLTVAV